MLLIYTHTITPRIEYIFSIFFHGIYFLDYRLTSEETVYRNYQGAKFSYGNHPLEINDTFWQADTLLFEKEIKNFRPDVKIKDDNIFLIPTENPHSQQPFDPFAAAFYLISRYEEYLPYTPDRFNRFEADQSLMGQYHILHRPLVNEWASQIVYMLQNRFPDFHFTQPSFSGNITIDIDQAYAYKHKGLVRNAGTFVKYLLKGKIKECLLQAKTLAGASPDPFDSFPFLQETEKKRGIPIIYFVNLGKYSAFDRNLPPHHPALHKLLKKLAETNSVGIHPSYYANDRPELFTKETILLSGILDMPVIKSRQHYLRLKFPDTYHHLIKNGIKEDYSLGYATMPGFRAGTCTPFYWFDLMEDKCTHLKIYPTIFMEVTFLEDLNMQPLQAFEEMKKLIDTVKNYKGHLIFIWHNTTASDSWHGRKEWKDIFSKVVDYLSEG